MDKKFLGVILLGVILIVFKDEIRDRVSTMTTVQKLMIGQVMVLGAVLLILIYYIVSRIEE